MSRFRVLPRPGPPVVIAHRGDSSHAPENTLEAARLGHASGAFAWELDVHLSRDGVPLVIHDETLSRTTDAARRFAGDPRGAGGFRVADFDWDEIRGLDAGSWFVEPRGGPRSASAFGTLAAIPAADLRKFGSGSVRVPSLQEALEFTRDLDWLVNVEIKSFPESDPRLVGMVVEAIDRAGIADRVLISSFDHDDVARVARLRPGIATGVLNHTPLHDPSDYVRRNVGADFLHASAEAFGSLSTAYRRSPSPAGLHRSGRGDIPTLIYTVNDAGLDGLAVHLGKVGVAGIFTDNPAALMRLFYDDEKSTGAGGADVEQVALF